MNVRQVLNVVHSFTQVYFETINGDLIPLKEIDPIDLEQVLKKQVLKVTPTDYLEIKLLVGNIKCANSK